MNVGFPAFGATLNFNRQKGRVSAVAPAQGPEIAIDGLAGKTTNRRDARRRDPPPGRVAARRRLFDPTRRLRALEFGLERLANEGRRAAAAG